MKKKRFVIDLIYVIEGMRFALLEIKLTLAKILRNFNISSVENLSEAPKMIEGLMFSVRRLKDPLKLIFTKRELQ